MQHKNAHLCLIWCRVVRSRDVHPCHLAIWSRVVQSRDVSPNNFDGLAMSSSAFSVAPDGSEFQTLSDTSVCSPRTMYLNNIPVIFYRATTEN